MDSNRIKEIQEEKAKRILYEATLKTIRDQLFDSNNCDTILTKTIDNVINKH